MFGVKFSIHTGSPIYAIPSYMTPIPPPMRAVLQILPRQPFFDSQLLVISLIEGCKLLVTVFDITYDPLN